MNENRRKIDIDIAIIIQRLDDFKELMLTKFITLENSVKYNCADCAYAQKLLMKADANWWHIVRLWAMVGIIWTTIFAIIGMYLKHHIVH
jgi:hypothetical protein